MSIVDNALNAQLKVAITQVQKVSEISKDSDFVFNFLNASKAAVGQGGFLVPAVASDYPALMTANGAMVVGVLGPCGLNTPHVHPRGSEIQIVISGSSILTGMMMENGARVVTNIVNVGSATVFPQGSVHFQQNMGCDPTTFVSSFDYYDPGTGQIAQQLFGMDKGVVNATLGELVSFMSNVQIPASVALGAQECLDRCHIDRASFNFTSTFGDYVAFSNSTWTVPSPLPASVSSLYMTKQTSGALAAANVDQGSTNIPFNQNPLKNTVIGLGAASAALMMACMGMLIMICMRRRNTRKTTPMYAAPTPIATYRYSTPYDDTEELTRMHTPPKA